MPRLTPMTWREFVERLRQLGFEGACQAGISREEWLEK